VCVCVCVRVRCVEKYNECLDVWCVCGEEGMEEPPTISFRHTKSHENEKHSSANPRPYPPLVVIK